MSFEGPVVRMPVSNLGERLIRPRTEELPTLTDRSAAHQNYYASQLADRPRQWTVREIQSLPMCHTFLLSYYRLLQLRD